MTAQADVRRHPSGSTDGAEAEDPRPTPATPADPPSGTGWTEVCPLEKLQPERGVRALVDGEPVAVFRLYDGRVFALHDVDPFSGASVLSRGIVGDVGGTPVVASPLYKQHFGLESGRALEDEGVGVATYPVRVVNGTVEVGARD